MRILAYFINPLFSRCGFFFIILILCITLSAGAIMFMYGISNAQTTSVVKVDEGEEWHYFRGETEPPPRWSHFGFDDSVWERGASSIGYGRENIRTRLEDMRSRYSKIYARRDFTVNDPSTISRISLAVFCDGPFRAYLNGIEVVRYTISQAPSGHSQTIITQPELMDLSGIIHELLQGKNILAIECNNDDINSLDFSFIPFFEVIEE